MTESLPDNLDPDAVEALVASTSPEDWEAIDIVFSSNLVVQLQIAVERALFALLTLAPRQDDMPILEWVKTTAREQALRTLHPERSGGRREAESGEWLR